MNIRVEKTNFFAVKVQGGIFLTLLAVLESFFLVGVPFCSGKFIDALTSQRNQFLCFFLLISCMLAALIFSVLKKRCSVLVSRRVELGIQQKLLAEMLRLKPGYAAHFANGEIGMKFLRDAQIYSLFYRDLYPQATGLLCGFVFAIFAVFCHSWLIVVVFLVFMGWMWRTLLPFKRRFTRSVRGVRSVYDRSINQLLEFMHIYPFLKSMAAEKPFASQPRGYFSKFRSVNLVSDLIDVRFEQRSRLILFFGETCILGVAGFLTCRRILSPGDVIFIQMLFLSVMNNFASLFQLMPMRERICEAERSLRELYESHQFEDVSSGKFFPGLSGDIIAEEVTFRYPGSGNYIFENFSCRIPHGSSVALTGANGSGKTTLLKLLTGYLEPTSGQIYMGKEKLSAFSKISFRSKISYVFQDALLITGSLRDNITLKNPGFTDDDIKEALSLSGADSVIQRLPDGIEHQIGFHGSDLSGGERQKIAVARALIRKPQIMIFDEVTNHLDYVARMKIRDLIISLHGKCTVLMVTHDPELIALCDAEVCLNQKDNQKNVFQKKLSEAAGE